MQVVCPRYIKVNNFKSNTEARLRQSQNLNSKQSFLYPFKQVEHLALPNLTTMAAC